ncbi:MAG TPA: hypothetical protein VH442_08625, partial [Micromonosporaceae bacterium]
THNVSVSVTTSADGDDVAAATVSLTSTSDATWTLSPQPATSTPRAAPNHGVVDTWQFLAVPFGDWKLSITLPAGHLGVLAGSNPTLTCTGGGTAAQRVCTGSPITVPGSGNPNTPVTVGYTLDEFRVGLSVVAHKLTSDPNVVPPASVHVSVADTGGTVYDNTTFTVSASAPSPPTDSFWGRAGRSYTVTTTSGAANWTAANVTLTGAAPSTPVALNEIGAAVTVTVTGLGGDPNARVTLVPPTGSGITAPAAQTTATSVTFDDVPFGTGWTARAVSATRNGTKGFDITAKTVAVSVPLT